MIALRFPSGVGHTFCAYVCRDLGMLAQSLLLQISDSLCLDFVARQKVGGTSFDLRTISSNFRFSSFRLHCLPTSTSSSRASSNSPTPATPWLPFARDLGYEGPPFAWDEDRRALLRAELDAFYARAYGLTRDELRYILDPADVRGPDYPSETFRVLKDNEMSRYGEYRTAPPRARSLGPPERRYAAPHSA